jgi:hypothetical protein
MLLRLNRCRKLNQCVTPFPNGKSKTGFVEGRWEIFSVADCREPLGASGRHGGDDWFSRPVVAGIFAQAGRDLTRRRKAAKSARQTRFILCVPASLRLCVNFSSGAGCGGAGAGVLKFRQDLQDEQDYLIES